MDNITLRYNDGRFVTGKRIKFISRIANDGTEMIKYKDGEQPSMFGTSEIVVNCLSITHKRWIATDGMSCYIVELQDTPVTNTALENMWLEFEKENIPFPTLKRFKEWLEINPNFEIAYKKRYKDKSDKRW